MLDPRSYLLTVLVPLLSLAALASNRAVSPAGRPNIVLILTDDQGFGDLGCMGNPVLETPHIDAMARRSTVLERFHVSPVCTPTRASLMTGRYSYRTRAFDTFKGRAMLDPQEVTVAEVLREHGYATGVFGKWHLGDCYPMRAMDQGFEESLVHRGGGLAQPSEPLENARRYSDPILWRNGRQIHASGYCTDVYFEAAIQFMKRSRAAKRPFFTYLATNAPHGPYHDVPQDLYQKYRAKNLTPALVGGGSDTDRLARIFAMIENIDQNVGRLFACLEDLGLTNDTLVIFMVDNGPNTRRFVGNLRGMKSEVHEGGIRSPFLAHWPARLKPGTSCDRIAAHIDVMPTLLEAAGVSLPGGLALDGRSVLPLLEGRTSDWPNRTLFLQSHRGDAPVRYHHFAAVTQQWKLVRPSGFGRERPREVPFELYDLQEDPGEAQDLSGRHPEIVARLKADYDAWFDGLCAKGAKGFAPPRIIIGSDHEPTTTLTLQDWRPGVPAGWGREGRWLLMAERDARFDVTVILREPATGRATLQLGDITRSRTLNEPSARLLFEDVPVTRGNLALQFRLMTADEPLDPYQVLLIRRG